MDILLKPDLLSLVGSMNHFVIATNKEITFVLKYADLNNIIVQHTYTPSKLGRVEIDVESIISPLLSFKLLDVTEPYQQTSIARKFIATISTADSTA